MHAVFSRLATVIFGLSLLAVTVTAGPMPDPTPAPVNAPRVRANIIRDTLPSLFKRQDAVNGSIADSVPETCQTTCAYTIGALDACSAGLTQQCLGVCTSRNVNSMIVCINCIYRASSNVSYSTWESLFSSISVIENVCQTSGREVTATEQWVQWTPYVSSTSSSSASSSSSSSSASADSNHDDNPPKKKSSAPVGAIVGGVVGGVIALLALILLLLFLRRRKRRRASHDLTPRAYTDASPPMSAIQQGPSINNNDKFDIDPSVSPYVAATSSGSSSSPGPGSSGPGSDYEAAALAAAYASVPTSPSLNHPMPPIPDEPLENPHQLPPGAGATATKAQAAAIPEPEEVEFVRHVDAGPSLPGSTVDGDGRRRTIIDLPPQYQNAR